MRRHSSLVMVLLVVMVLVMTWTSAAGADEVHGCNPTWWQKQHGDFSCSATTMKTILSCYGKTDTYSEDEIISCMGCSSTDGPGASGFLQCAKHLGFEGTTSSFGPLGWDGVRDKIAEGNDVAVLYRTDALKPLWQTNWGHWSYLYEVNATSVRLLCPSKGWVDISKEQMTQAILMHGGEGGEGTLVFLRSPNGGLNPIADELKYQSWVFHNGRTSDIDGDGKQDVCGRFIGGLGCYLSKSGVFDTSIGGPPFADESGWKDPTNYTTIRLGDINGDGLADVCARTDTQIECYPSTGKGFGPAFGGLPLSDEGGWNALKYFGSLQLADVNGDGRDDVCVRGLANLDCHKSTGKGFEGAVSLSLPDSEGWDRPEYGGTLRMGDINGDGKADVCARGVGGMRCWVSDGEKFTDERGGPAWSDEQSWGGNHYEYWSTIRLADINGDGMDDLCARSATSIVCSLSTGTGFGPTLQGPELSDAGNWNDVKYFSTIRFGDVDGDGKQDLCARGLNSLQCWSFQGTGFTPLFSAPEFSDAEGWDKPHYYRTITLADFNGDGKADVCARGAGGWLCRPSDGSKLGPATVPIEALSDAGGWTKPEYYATLRMHGVKKHEKPPAADASVAETGAGSNGGGDGGQAGVGPTGAEDAGDARTQAAKSKADSSSEDGDSGCTCAAVAGRTGLGLPLAFAGLSLTLTVVRRRRQRKASAGSSCEG